MAGRSFNRHREPPRTSAGLHGSQTAALIRSYPPDVAQRLKVTPLMLAVVDVVVALADGYQQGLPADTLWQEIVTRFGEPLEPHLRDVQAIEAAVTRLTDDINTLTETLGGNVQFNTWLAKRVGRKRYDQLRQAFLTDSRPVVDTVATFVRGFLPMALAAKDAAEPLTPRQLSGIGVDPGVSLLWATATMYDLVQQAWEYLNPGSVALPQTTLTALEGDLRSIIQDDLPSLIRETAPYVLHKLQGASFALDNGSPDAASQAANSLIELTDRLIRGANTDVEVVLWLQSELPQRLDELAPEKDGKRRPTRKGRALCYVYGKGQVVDDSPLHELAAESLIAVHRRLQPLKHNDQGEDREVGDVRAALKALTGALTLIIRIGSARLFEIQAPTGRISDVNA